MPAPQWHWVGFGEISKNIEVRNAAKTEGGAYGTKYLFDQVEPDETAEFFGQFLTLADVMALRTIVKTPFGTKSVTTVLGQTWDGLLVRFKPTYIRGTEYYNCSITLLNPSVSGP